MFKKIGLENHMLFFVMVPLILIKFLIARTMLFGHISIIQTILVELGYLILLFGIVELFPSQKFKKILSTLLNIIFSFILLSILMYHDYYGYIVTINALTLTGQVGVVKDSILQLLNPTYLILFADIFILGIYSLFRRKSSTKLSIKNTKFVVITITVGLIVVGLNLFLQKDKVIANTVIAAEKQGILTYEILAAKNIAQSANLPVLSTAEIAALPSKIQGIKGITPLSEEELKLSGIAKDKNIIVIQAEAFQNFTINLEVDGQEITPFLNDLIGDSLYFSNVYQQIGPGNTSDAEFIFNTSLYPDAWKSSSETYGDRQIPSFPKLLKEDGYKSLTFHANDVTFWNRNNLYPALGFDDYYDIEFFGKEDVIGIGPSDEYVYEKVVPELKKFYDNKQKFYAQIVTLSSHHPFQIPSDKDIVKLPSRFDGSLVGDYLEAINYTDQALGQLVQMLKDEGMWEDTILVFYGDHFGLQPNGLEENDFSLLKELIGHDYTFMDQFNIPFIVSVGGETIGEVNETTGGQLDMMPTVANMLGLSLENHVYFGQDILNYSNNLFGSRYYMPFGSFFNKDIVFKPAEGFTDGEAYNLQTSEKLQDFSLYENDYNRILELLQLSDDYMNSLPFR